MKLNVWVTRWLVLSTTLGALLVALAGGCQHSPAVPSGVQSTDPTVFESDSGDYFELHDERIYVFGSRESLEKFQQTRHMPYTFTEIGVGPGGTTVVFEAPKDDPGVQARLQATFRQRHGS